MPSTPTRAASSSSSSTPAVRPRPAAAGHLNHVLAALDNGISPNAPALTGTVTNLPTALTDASVKTPGPQIPNTPNPDGGFLGISSQIQELFIKPPASCPTCLPQIQD